MIWFKIKKKSELEIPHFTVQSFAVPAFTVLSFYSIIIHSAGYGKVLMIYFWVNQTGGFFIEIKVEIQIWYKYGFYSWRLYQSFDCYLMSCY